MLPVQEEIVDALFPRPQDTGNTETKTIFGVAVGNSSNGAVMVNYETQIAGEYTTGQTADVLLPTTVTVHTGDHVIISLVGSTDAKSPVVTGAFN